MRPTSSLILLLVSLLLLATLQIHHVSAAPSQALETRDSTANALLLPRQAAPPKGATQPKSKPQPKTPEPNPTSGTRSLVKKLIKKLLDDVEAGDPPVVDEPVHVPEDVEYPLRAEGKIKKREKADAKDDTDQDDCARETCLSSEKCVHMAGRQFWAKWVTCCPNGQFADFDGFCCKKSLGKGTGHGNLCPQNPRA